MTSRKWSSSFFILKKSERNVVIVLFTFELLLSLSRSLSTFHPSFPFFLLLCAGKAPLRHTLSMIQNRHLYKMCVQKTEDFVVKYKLFQEKIAEAECEGGVELKRNIFYKANNFLKKIPPVKPFRKLKMSLTFRESTGKSNTTL